MNMLLRLYSGLETRYREGETFRALSRLDDRQLADFGLAREDIRHTARLAARAGGLALPLDGTAHFRADEARTGAAFRRPAAASIPAGLVARASRWAERALETGGNAGWGLRGTR